MALEHAPYLPKLALLRGLEAITPAGIGSLTSVKTDAPSYSLTFDDGPTPERTPQVLRALADYRATATFFVLMRNVRAHPRLLQEVVAAGNEIGLHGMDHRRLCTVPPDELLRNLRLARAELEDIAQSPIALFRPPYGAHSTATGELVREAGFAQVLWSRTAWDWKETSQSARVIAASMLRTRGSIILAHDGHANHLDLAENRPEPSLDRYALLTRVLSAYRAAGLSSCTVSQLLAAGSPRYRIPLDGAAFRRLITHRT